MVSNLKACELVDYVVKKSKADTLRRHFLEVFQTDRVRDLFRTRTLALSTGLIMAIWALTGLVYPLYNGVLPYKQASRRADIPNIPRLARCGVGGSSWCVADNSGQLGCAAGLELYFQRLEQHYECCSVRLHTRAVFHTTERHGECPNGDV